VLPPRTIVDLGKLLDVPSPRFRLDDELWARVVYDFALGYRLRVLPRDHLCDRSYPCIRGGWPPSSCRSAMSASRRVDQRVEDLCAAFELQKPY
jgi:hypothetical protein